MKINKIKAPDIKNWCTKVRNLKKEDVITYWKNRKLRREQILQNRKESKFSKLMKPYIDVFNKFSLIFHMLLACCLNFVMEIVSRHSYTEAWEYMTGSPYTFLYNAFLIFITFSIVYLVRRRTFTRIIISVLWLTLGIANGYMLMKRVTPFNAQDLKVLGDGITLIKSYFEDGELGLVIIAIVAVIVWLISMWKRGGQFQGKMHRVVAIICCGIWVGIFMLTTNLALENRIISNYFGNIAFAYEDYGLPYCFMSSIFNTGISQPHAYSEEVMLEISNDGSMSEKVETKYKETPNIIVVQLESFFDPNEIEFFETSIDPIPNFRKIANEHSAGYFKVPSVGAGTANTEFEVLTGMSMRYFGPGEYPFKTILKKSMVESAATALKDLEYGAHALHNNGGNFYSRSTVYDHMGFDSYTSKEFMNILQVTPQGWAKDNILIEHIEDALNTTPNQDFVFTVSVEGHGSYPEDYEMENPPVKLTGIEDKGKQNAWEYYVSLVHEMDKFVGNLVKMIEKRNEPTVMVFYGDHLPTLGIEAEDLKSRYLYNTNYAIWDNIGLKEKDQNLAAYQLMAEVFEQIGIESGTVFNYHQDRRKSKNYLSDLELLQYDLLYGKKFAYQGQQKLAEEGTMQMGIRDVELTGTSVSTNNSTTLDGINFTKWSDVYINGQPVKHTFVNDTRIDLNKYALKEDDTITIIQMGSSETPFRISATYRYNEGELTKITTPSTNRSWKYNLEQ